MPRPSVSVDTQRRLFKQVRENCGDDVPVSPSHEEALAALLDYVESEPHEEVEDRQPDFSLGSMAQDSGGFM